MFILLFLIVSLSSLATKILNMLYRNNLTSKSWKLRHKCLLVLWVMLNKCWTDIRVYIHSPRRSMKQYVASLKQPSNNNKWSGKWKWPLVELLVLETFYASSTFISQCHFPPLDVYFSNNWWAQQPGFFATTSATTLMALAQWVK